MKSKLEDKAKTIIAALTISITLILNLSYIIEIITLKVQQKYFAYVLFLIAILSILYMIIAGILSIQVLIKENVVYTIPLEERENRKRIIQITQLNINQNLIRNNDIYAAYLLIRNSVICLFIIFVLAICPYEKVENINVNVTQMNNDIELVYSSNAVEWLVNNSQKNLEFDEIIEAYNNICSNGEEKTIYDKKQDIAVTLVYQNDSYFIFDIRDDIAEVY
ncbi:MAG: hypothetical protein ACK5LL_00780 [Suipraeoptans sp.]